MAYERVNWENLPSTKTPINQTNLNKMENGIDQAGAEIFVGAEEPTTGEKVWFNKHKNSIYVRNSNGVYEEFIKKTQKVAQCYTGYSITEQILDTNYTKVSNLEVTLDTYGGDILCTVSIPSRVSAAGTGSAYIYLDNKRIDRILTLNGENFMMYSAQYLLKNVSEGKHTISVYARSDNSSYNLIIPKNTGKSFSAIEL